MLIPREHGAYGQLLFPMVSALAIGHPALGAYLLSLAAVCAFLVHEPLLVMLGQRGSRAAREQRADARRSLLLFGSIGGLAGLASLGFLPRDVLTSLLVPLALAVLVGAAVSVRIERSTLGELLVGATLSSASLPVALAGGVPMASAVTLVVVFALVFATATMAVRAMIGRMSKAGGPRPIVAGAFTLLVIAGLAALALTGRLSTVAPFAALPVCSVAMGLATSPPSPRHLRVVGWTLVGATALTAAILVRALSL